MDTLESDNIDEFITIIQLLEDKDLSVLHQVLLVEDEKEQHSCLRRYRDKVVFYPALYNAICASRSLILPPLNPITYINTEIIARFNRFNLNN